MHKILLTNDNIQSLKSNLKKLYPTLKPSLLSESMARALGFNSNAALIVSTRSSNKPKIDLLSFDEDIFYSWLKNKGNNLNQSISFQVFEDVHMPLWKCFKGSPNHRLTLLNDWCKICQNFNIPNVWLEKKTKYTSLHWDYISVNESHNPHKFRDEDANKISSLIDKYGSKNTKVQNSSLFVGSITGLDQDSAELIALELFYILHSLIDEN